MLKVNGFYGHVMRNNFRSLWIFLGFAVAFQILCGVVISIGLLFIDPSKMIFVNPFGYLAEYGPYVGMFGLIFFFGNLFLYKQNIEKDMNFNPVGSMSNQRLHKIVQDLAITAGIQEPEIALIETDARNAFVCGLNESSSTLVVTRGLLQSLDDEELAAVIAHEITHIKNGDIRLMAFANTAMSSLLFLEKLNILKVRGTKTAIFMVLFPPFLILFLSAGFVSGVAMAIGKVSRLMIASSREFIADAEAVRLTHNPAALISALKKIEGMSEIDGIDPIADAMMIDGATVGEFATHPTIAERISVLVKHSGGMAYETRARKDTRFGNQGSFGARTNTGQPIFGLKSKNQQAVVNRTEKYVEAPMSVLDRVNVGNDRNIVGLPHGVAKVLKYGFICMFALSIFSSFARNQKFRSISKELSTSQVSNDVVFGNVQNLSTTSKVAKPKKPKTIKSGYVKEEGATLPSYYVYLGATRFDLVLVALIAMTFLAYAFFVKSSQSKRENEIEQFTSRKY
jgi:Zn-dependent protease with chaperone function